MIIKKRTSTAKPVKKTTSKSKKKKKTGRYHTGTYMSSKCKKPINFRSGWEEVVCRSLDRDLSVVEYSYEDLIIPYRTKPTQIKIKKYIVDFFVTYSDGTKKIIEVKAENKINHPITLRKTAAAIQWCSKNNVVYEIWSNKKIKELLAEEKNLLTNKVAANNKASIVITPLLKSII